MQNKLTAALLRTIWPNGNSRVPGLIEGIAASAPTVFAKYGLNSDLVVAQAMAQFSHECGAGTEMVENIHYTAERAAEVWPLKSADNEEQRRRHFADAADVYRKTGSYAGDPQFTIKLIDLVYGTRMGNRPGTHDGSDNIGRGLSQCTGREGYEKLQAKTGLPLLANPSMVNDPAHALECGVADFVICGCLPFAERDDIDNVTLKLNGGHIGLAERKAWLARWKAALASAPVVSVTSPTPQPAPAPAIEPKHVAAAVVVSAGSAAATQSSGWPMFGVIVVVTIIAAFVAWRLLHRPAATP